MRRVASVGAALAVVGLTTPYASGQLSGGPVESYYVNDGRNNQHDIAFGEFSVDLGSAIPFERYGAVSPPGHYFALAWTGTGTFVDYMYDHAMDFEDLVSTLTPYLPPGGTVAPAYGVNVFQDPRAVDATGVPLPLPISAEAWWYATGGGGGGGTGNPPRREILYWPYKINGGAVMICMAGDGNGVPLGLGGGDPPKSLLVYNYYNHPSSYGSNKNRFDDTNPDGWRREFSRTFDANIPFAEAWWEGSTPTAPLLGPKEQAIEAGDVVVIVQENFGMGIPAALARTQEAVWFTKHVFAGTIPGVQPPNNHFNVAGAYVHGTSFGQAMAMFLALLQPQDFRGAVDWITSDLGFEIGDFSDLQWDFSAGLDRAGFQATTDNFFPDLYAFVDHLGIRFDDPKNGQKGWDLAAFSLNRRPSSVKIPMTGHVGEHEFQFPGSWCADDPALAGLGASISMTLYRNRAHEEMGGVLPGVNEFAIYDGNEWANAKSANSNPQATPNRIVPHPSIPAPSKPYPDPYTHTLRPPVSGPVGGNVLTLADARQGMDGADAYHGDGYRHPTTGSNPLKMIGQGIWPGYRDQMRVADLDADGEMEVIFGNLDGYVHILEFAGGGGSGSSVGNPTDPYRLVDEWQSPRLGRAVFACDAVFNAGNGLAQITFADGRGQVWRIEATGPNQYQMGNGGLPLVTPVAAQKLTYDGSTPLLLIGDFDGGHNGQELLLMNRFFDWSLFSYSGVPIGSGTTLPARLTRSTRTGGPTDAFVVEASDGDTFKEVMLGSTNGSAWLLNRKKPTPTSPWEWEQPPLPILPVANCAVAKLVPCFFNGGSTPTHFLAFCRDDDRDDSPGTAPPGAVTTPDVIQLWYSTFAPPALPPPLPPPLITEIAGAGGFNEAMSFAWIDRPRPGVTTAKFAIATQRLISVYTVNTASPTGPTMVLTGTLSTVPNEPLPPDDPDVRISDVITSLDCPNLENGSGGKSRCLVYATSKGRIYVVSPDLVSLRNSAQEFGTPLPPQPSSEFAAWPTWPSNRTLGQVPACDSVAPTAGALDLYFAEYSVPSFLQTPVGGSATRRYRIGRIGIGAGAGAPNTWQSYVELTRAGSDWELLRPGWTRALQVTDFVDNDNGAMGADGEPEFRVFTETGVAFVDQRSTGPVVREFQTSSYAPRALGGISAFLAWRSAGYPVRMQQGGRVFELHNERRSGDYWHLGGFTPPPDPLNVPPSNGNYFFVRASGGASPGWWYPKVGSNFLSGQISTHMQSAHELSLGTSMTIARIRVPEGGGLSEEPVPHVVAGTTSGYVYAIQPIQAPPAKNDADPDIDSVLRHLSTHLGTYVVGLDAGDLDGDEAAPEGDVDDEIVCGTWLDNGSFADWDPVAPNLSKNRAHLYVFDPQPGASMSFMDLVAELDGDDLVGPGNGISSGVTCVKIDNVDGDDDNEIWCTDATGYIYLFAKDANDDWGCVYRSDDYCAYPGFYNNLHPVKDGAGKTVKLAVQAPGYFFLFDVDSTQVGNP